MTSLTGSSTGSTIVSAADGPLEEAITLRQAKTLVACMAHEQSFLLLSPPGVGKSEMVYQAAAHARLPCRSLLGTQIAPEDVSGIPRIVGERSVFCPPRVLLPETPEPFCLFLDELPACAPDVQKAFYSLDDPGGSSEVVTALRGIYRTPWEVVLQRWLESVAPGERTFVRPSRRGADRSDLVLPGRRREGWMLTVILDTSGSMIEEIPRALGAIADFCEAVAVDQIRLLQCDVAVTSDETLSPTELARYQVTGFGGSDLTPAMELLAADPQIRAAAIITDGDIQFPPGPMPYAVLWVLPPTRSAGFAPGYGRIVAMDSQS